ncbi:spore germination protein GerPF-like protein [Bacillus cereus]|nr:spore germination protein GerPF-like protein [Bacillus cereus]
MPSVVEGVIIENCNGTINLGDKYNVQPIEKTFRILPSPSSLCPYSHVCKLP